VAKDTVRVEGYREFLRAVDRADQESKRLVRETFRAVGDAVRRQAVARFVSVDVGTAAGFQATITQKGVAVYQTRQKVTGKRGDYGALQMRKALVPARASQREETERAFERAMDIVADHFERGP
jgi:hypothetical protein